MAGTELGINNIEQNSVCSASIELVLKKEEHYFVDASHSPMLALLVRPAVMWVVRAELLIGLLIVLVSEAGD